MFADSKKVYLIVFVVSLVSFVVVLFGLNAYPPPSSTSALFIPAAVNFSAGKGLINEISHYAQWIDTTGGYRFLTYMPFFPIFLSILMPHPTSSAVFLVVAILQVFVIALSAFFLFKIATLNGKKLTWPLAILIGLASVVLVAPFQNISTRSDILFQLILLISMFSVFYLFKSKFLGLILGVLLGISAGTHPMYLVTLASLIGMFAFAVFPTRKSIIEVLKISGVALVSFFFIMFVTPFGIFEKISSVLKHGAAYSGGSWFWFGGSPENTFAVYFNDFVTRFFSNPVSFFSGALFLIFIILGFRLYLVNRQKIKSPILFGASLILFLLMILSVVGRPVHIYFFQMLYPLVLALIIYSVAETNPSNFWKSGITVVFLLVSIGFVRQASLLPFFLKEGVSLNEARSFYNELRPSDCVGRCVGLASIGLWPLSENYGEMITELQAKNMGKRLGDLVGVILFEQSYSGRTSPPDSIDDCALDKNYFIEKQPKLFGFKLGNTMPGYGFASYLCES